MEARALRTDDFISWRDKAIWEALLENTHRRFCRWRDKAIWEALLEKVVVDPDFGRLIIGASHSKGHPHAAGAKGGNQERGRSSKGGSIQSCIWP